MGYMKFPPLIRSKVLGNRVAALSLKKFYKGRSVVLLYQESFSLVCIYTDIFSRLSCSYNRKILVIKCEKHNLQNSDNLRRMKRLSKNFEPFFAHSNSSLGVMWFLAKSADDDVVSRFHTRGGYKGLRSSSEEWIWPGLRFCCFFKKITMKLYAISVVRKDLKSTTLVSAYDLQSFGYFQRSR